jgi:flavin reductase (DIM6/NTAB) family NADH-FMN oxidoreductase RutF
MESDKIKHKEKEMKNEYSIIPNSMKNIDFYGFSWIDFVTSIPSPLFLVTTYKSNGKPNACLQSWSTFCGNGDNFFCIMASVNKNGHMYKSVKETGEMVLNFPSTEIYPKCIETIKNNGFDTDEITESGLTVEKAKKVNAPRIKECFLNMECEYLWEKEQVEGSDHVVMCVKTVNISMDNEYFDEETIGRYGKMGYIYNIHNPINPETGKMEGDCLGVLERIK